ncbi:hypothetical protein [Streptomyces sp. B1I3]|uniref:hypothetical protein n=1 Tax=Streptomyces sp. B1I3 TaxID=3042264 RepID=UPI00278972BA|nr:hypothetical protein [Streptomyces sp. B1I3]MDQ0791772.1 hypothetical protein [Streptomyces sp. B1I3]
MTTGVADTQVWGARLQAYSGAPQQPDTLVIWLLGVTGTPYDDCVVLSYGRTEKRQMDFTGAGEMHAAPGLRTAVGIFSGKTDRTLSRISELKAELADL